MWGGERWPVGWRKRGGKGSRLISGDAWVVVALTEMKCHRRRKRKARMGGEEKCPGSCWWKVPWRGVV